MATSMKALPRMVKIRNFIAEYSLRPVPQMEMSMYIGTSSSSQNRKNSSRSRGGEHTHNRSLEQQQPEKVLLDPQADMPRRQHRRQTQQAGQRYQRGRQPVHGQQV